MYPQQQQKQERECLAVSFKPENFIPGLVIGFILGFLLDLSKPTRKINNKRNVTTASKHQNQRVVSSSTDEELKMVPSSPSALLALCLLNLCFYVYFNLVVLMYVKYLNNLFLFD